MKYVVDIDAFKTCVDYLADMKVNGDSYTMIEKVKSFVDDFPKETLDANDREMSYWLPFTAENGTKYKTCGKCNHDILDGEVDYYCPKCGSVMDPRTTLGNLGGVNI